MDYKMDDLLNHSFPVFRCLAFIRHLFTMELLQRQDHYYLQTHRIQKPSDPLKPPAPHRAKINGLCASW